MTWFVSMGTTAWLVLAPDQEVARERIRAWLIEHGRAAAAELVAEAFVRAATPDDVSPHIFKLFRGGEQQLRDRIEQGVIH